jgi:hypothetical protein
MEKNVLLLSPMTFYAFLKSVSIGWQENAMSKNAKEIAKQSKELIKRFETFYGHFDKIDKALASARTAYDSAVSSYNSRLLPAFNRFETLSGGTEELLLEDDYFSFVFNTLYLTSKAMEKCKNGDLTGYLTRLKAVFELKTVCFAGFMPDVTACAFCGAKKDIEYFDTASGIVVCKNCHERAGGDLYKINDKILSQLSFILNADYKSVFAYGGAEGDVETVSQIAEKYMINSLEIFPTSLTYLKNTVFGQK